MIKHIAIVGARRTDRETVDRLVAGFPADVVIVSGGAKGPDTWVDEAARKRELAIKIFHPISLEPKAKPRGACKFSGKAAAFVRW